MRLHPYAPLGILIAITIGGVALTSTLEKTYNSMKAKPATSSIVKVTPKPVVVTPKTYYDSAKDECHMRDGSGVFINYAKNLPDHLCDTLFSTYNIEEYAKSRRIPVVKPGRYDMSLTRILIDPDTGCERMDDEDTYHFTGKREIRRDAYISKEDFATCQWEQTRKQRLNEVVSNCRAGHYGNLRGEEAVNFCNLHYPTWRD